MHYSQEVLSRATARLHAAREDHASLLAAREAEVHRRVPRIREIDRLMRVNFSRAAYAVFSEGAQEAMENARQQNKALQAERDELMAAHFEPNFLPRAAFCPTCGGTGYVGSTMCDCLKALCLEEQRKELGAIFSGSESFASFRLDYYSDLPLPGVGHSARTIMERNLTACRDYARSFGPGSGNLLLIGGTGLGKTHLALATGRAVGEMGYGVCYETAASLFSTLEQAKFNPTPETLTKAHKLENCDLLILDDLGTEMPGQFVIAALYGLMNARLMARKPMIITTNLNVNETGKRYSPQIASRLYGEFARLTFVGEDVRVMKNRSLL